MIRRFHERKNLSKDEHIIQKDIFHVRFETADFSEKEFEAVNIIKTNQISLKIKKCKRFKTKFNTKLKNHKKIALKYLIYNIRKYNLSEY